MVTEGCSSDYGLASSLLVNGLREAVNPIIPVIHNKIPPKDIQPPR
jgi:hypothetical protein